MNSFMPSNLTSALYNQATNNNNKGISAEYSYDINLHAVNRSLNEHDPAPTKTYSGIYFGAGGRPEQNNTGSVATNGIIMEADEESYYQNESPVRGRKMNAAAPSLQQQQINTTHINVDARSGFSHSP